MSAAEILADTTELEAPPRLNPVLVEPVVKAALLEDLGGAGDLTTDAIVPDSAIARVRLAARKPGRIAGLDVAALAFQVMGPDIEINFLKHDGVDAAKGDDLLILEGPARAVLSAERVALNMASHLSGIATCTRDVVKATAGTKARVCCTRKTLPGLRRLQKYAVRVGGGMNHRWGLDDAVLVKDNHLAIAGGIKPAVERLRRHVGHMVKIQVEVDSPDQLEELLRYKVDAVLLDNMSPATMREACALIDGRMIAEASGGITPETVATVAASGVDLISLGWLTHSVTALDLGLDFDRLG